MKQMPDSGSIPQKSRLAIRAATVAVAHFALTVGATAAAFGRGMARFDSGAKGNFVDGVLQAMATVLGFPMLPAAAILPPSYFAGMSGYVLFAANSVAWGVGVTLLWRHLTRKGGA